MSSKTGEFEGLTLEMLEKLMKDIKDSTPQLDPDSQHKAMRLVGSRGTAKMRMKRLFEDLHIPTDLIQTDGKHGVLIPQGIAEILAEHVEKILREARELKEKLHEATIGYSLVVATTQLLGIRVLPHWIREFRLQFPALARKAGLGEIKTPQILTQYAEPDDLLDTAAIDPNTDLILSYCASKQQFRKEKLAEGNLHRCLLVSSDHELANPDVRCKLQEPGGFKIDKHLHGVRIVLPSDTRLFPGLDRAALRKVANVVTVHTTMETHERVRALSSDAAFSHREFLSEGENKYLTVIDLSEHEHLGESKMILLAGPRFKEAPDPESTREQLIKILGEFFASQLSDLAVRHKQTNHLSGLLRRFRYAMHTSDVPREGKAVDSTWFRGTLFLEATSPFITRPNQYLSLVKGRHTISGDESMNRRFDVIGRILTPQNGEGYHLLWRGTHGDDENGAGSMVFSQHELENEEYLAGIWIGRSSWTSPLTYVPTYGVFIFDTIHNRNSKQLDAIVRKLQTSCPALKSALQRFQGIKQILGKVDEPGKKR